VGALAFLSSAAWSSKSAFPQSSLFPKEFAMRVCLVALTVVVLAAIGMRADEPRTTVKISEVRGQIKSVDADAKSVTVMVDGKARTFECAPNCRVTFQSAVQRRLPRRTFVQETIGTLSQLTEGTQVTMTVETANETDKVTQIRTQGVRIR
jgi:hypothetical protein